MTFLTSHLPFPSAEAASSAQATPLPPPGSHLVISDSLASPGNFAVYHLIAAGIARKQKVIWVDLKCEGKQSLEASLRRMAVVLPTTSELFVVLHPNLFADCSDQDNGPTLLNHSHEISLSALHKAILQHFGSQESLVILDGLSEVLAMGCPPRSVHQLVRSLNIVCRKTKSVLVSTLHVDHLGEEFSSDHDLLERQLRGASGWWRIESLASGRSGDIHGEISSHPLFCDRSHWTSVSRSQPLQYRLETNTVKVFPKGTGRGYL